MTFGAKAANLWFGQEPLLGCFLPQLLRHHPFCVGNLIYGALCLDPYTLSIVLDGQ